VFDSCDHLTEHTPVNTTVWLDPILLGELLCYDYSLIILLPLQPTPHWVVCHQAWATVNDFNAIG